VSVNTERNDLHKRGKRCYLVQEGWLLQTDRASAFAVDRAKVFLTCSLIIMQNLVVVSHTVCTHVGQTFWGRLGPTPWDGGVPVSPETRYCPIIYVLSYQLSLL